MPKQQEQDANLSTILSFSQREELILLIAKITASMRQTLVNNFDSSPPFSSSSPGSQSSSQRPNVDTAALSPEDREKAEKDEKARDRREKILSTPKLQELRVAALDFFQRWEESVHKRIGEVIVDSPEAAEKRQHETEAEAVQRPAMETTVINEQEQEKDELADTALHAVFPAVATELKQLEKEKKELLLNAVLLLCLSLEQYLAHSRVLLLHLASSLELSMDVLVQAETKVAQGLLTAAKRMSGNSEAQQRSEENQHSRQWKVGLATALGAVVLGVTGGLAAPLLSAGIGSAMGAVGLGSTAAAGLLGSVASSGIVVGSLFGAYGGRATGRMMDEYAKEVQDFAFLPLRTSSKRPGDENGRLRVAIGVSGWISTQEDVISPWRVLSSASEVFALRFELDSLLRLGNAMSGTVSTAAWAVAKKQIIKRTALATLYSALWPLNILAAHKLLANPFSVAETRAEKAGIVLADALVNKAQGERPVTLVGYSMGARVIFSCLMELAERRAFGIVESAVLVGAPCPSDAAAWCAIRSVVAGRLVNVFSEHDYVLAFLYRTSNIQFGVAGLQKVDCAGVENVDVSSVVSGHLRYMHMVGVVLRRVGWADLDLAEVEREEETLALLNDEGLALDEGQGVEDGEELEKTVERKNQQSHVQWAAEKLHIT